MVWQPANMMAKQIITLDFGNRVERDDGKWGCTPWHRWGCEDSWPMREMGLWWMANGTALSNRALSGELISDTLATTDTDRHGDDEDWPDELLRDR